MSYDYLEMACIGHGSCVQTSHNGIKKEESVCKLMWVPSPISWRFVHLGLVPNWGIQNESCRSKNMGKKLCWMIKNDSEKKFFSNLQTCFCTSFTSIDTAPKRIKLQRSAWWQIEAFLKCYPTATKRFICWEKIIS